MTIAPAIPYAKQASTPGVRNCGAACLSMVYGSFGLKVSQDEIWPNISKRNRFGSLASTTHLMAKDAIARGFDAVVIQASHPLQALRVCLENGLRVILNHRLDRESPTGHYSVLIDIYKSDVTLHDPLAGPSRTVGFPELLEVWRAGIPISETIGNVLIAIGPRGADRGGEPKCGICKVAIAPDVSCPRCHHPVPLRPAAALGCVAEHCAGRVWSYLCCPECDCTWSFHSPKPDAHQDKADPGNDPLDVDYIYQELDQFINQILDIPGASDHPDVRSQVAYIYSQKEPLRMAIAESTAHMKAHAEYLSVLTETVGLKRAAQRKRAEEAARQAAPLDGDELGMALLRGLGFVR